MDSHWWKVTTVILLLLLVGVVSGGTVYWQQQRTIKDIKEGTDEKGVPVQVTPTSVPVTNVPTLIPESSFTNLDSTWNFYANPKLGFGMKVPKSVNAAWGNCVWKTESGDHSYRPVEAMVPMTVLEGSDEAVVTQEYFYQPGEETKSGYTSYYAKCDKVALSLAFLDQKAAQEKQQIYTYSPSLWRIKVATVNGDTALEQFIKDNYGKGCKLGTKTLISNDTYKVTVQGDGKDLEQTECPLNYMYAVRYSPSRQKAASWGIGQSINFSSEGNKTAYDTEMVNSFRFLDQ